MTDTTGSAPAKDTFPPRSGGGSGGTPSEGPSGFGNLETAIGGADSVPDTPDAMPNVEPGAGPEPE